MVGLHALLLIECSPPPPHYTNINLNRFSFLTPFIFHTHLLIYLYWHNALRFGTKKLVHISSLFQHLTRVFETSNKKTYYGKLLSVFSFFATLTFFIQLSSPGFVGIDPYYHIKISELITQQGMLKEFPWTQVGIWKDKFADKEFLFHVYLIPFIFVFPNLIIAGKVAISVLVGVFFTLFYRLLNQFQVQHPFIWTLVGFGTNYIFIQRLCMVRPHVLSLVLILLFIESLWKQQRWKLLLISTVYALAYTAAHLPVCIAIIYGTVSWIHRKKFEINQLLLTFSGAVGGMVVHPQFPNNLKTWYVQNALLPVFNWGKSKEFWFVNEVKPLSLQSFISLNGGTS